MKLMKIISFFIGFIIVLFLTSCFEEPLPEPCDKDGWGVLSITNKSLNTVQRISIDNTNYGTIDPDETKEIDLPEGEYELRISGLNGGGCNPAQVTIPDCGKVGRSCSH